MAPAGGCRGRVRVSKNRKKSWGKYCDITEVEEFLEEKRFEERIGDPVAEKREDELFFFHVEKGRPAGKKEKRKKLEELVCHHGLTSYSQVPPPVNPQKGITKKRKAVLEAAERRLIKKLSKAQSKQQKEKHVPSSAPVFRDLWADENKQDDVEVGHLVEYRDEVTKKRPVKVPCHRYQKPSLLPAVEVPHPGASYNPSYEDHQALLKEAVHVEEKKLKEELHLKRILSDMFPAKEDAPNEETWVKEMSQGLFNEEGESDADELPELIGNPPVTTEGQKSRAQRRKQRELKKQARERLLAKQQKREMSKVFRLRSIQAEIKQAEELSKERQARKEQREIEKMYKPRTISQYKYEPTDLEVNLTEELPESLRVLKAEGNIFEDRYKSLQRRNIIEPRVKQKRKRKYKLKVQVKRSHREPKS